MLPAGTALAPIAADAIGRRSGLFDLLTPLDYPRRAVANAGAKLGGLLSGDTSFGDALMGAAPALLGGAAGLMTGNPLLMGALAAGGLQGLGEATGQEAFEAPTPQDVAQAMGGSPDSFLGTALANAAIDPLTYAGILPAIRGMRAPVQAQAAAMGLASAPTDAMLAGAENAYGGMMSRAREAATLGEAEAMMRSAMGGVDDYLARAMPGGEARFGAPLANPNNPGSTLQELLDFATDPRAAYVDYAPGAAANLNPLGQPLTSTIRTGNQAAPEVMEFLERTGQAMLPPGPGGWTEIAGNVPAGLSRGRGGWMGIGPEGLPPARDTFTLGALPPDLLRPQQLPSLAELTMGTRGGLPVASPTIPQSVSPVSAQQLTTARANLAGIGQAGTGVMDMPLDEAVRLLNLERRGAASGLQQALQQVQQLAPEQLEMLRRLYPGFTPGSAPALPGNLFNANPMV